MRFSQVEATTLPDQIGKPMLVLVGLETLTGDVWVKRGDDEWAKVSTPSKATIQAMEDRNDWQNGA